MGLLDWLFGTKKKKKKKDTNKWVKQAEAAKRNTQSNSKKGQRVSSNRPKATTAKPVSSSSRRGSYVSKATQKKAQTNATSIVNANREYTAYRKQAKKDEKAHDKKYGKTLLITPKGRNAKAFHDVNKGKATFAQNTRGNSKAYENVTSFYKQNKGEQDYAKKKVEEAYKHNAFGMGLKDSLRANFFGDDNTAKKVSERIGTKVNADLNNEKYQSGKDTGLLLSYLVPGMAQGKITSGIMKGAKAVTAATKGAKAVTAVGKSVPKLGKSVKMAGRARKLSAAHKVKKALKGTTKGQHFKAAMIADSLTSTPLNVSAAGAEARRVVDENKEQKQKLKAQSKEASKYLKDSKAAVAQYNKAISDVRNSSLPESEKKKYISNLKEERNKLIQSRRRASDNKEQLDSQSKSISTSVNKEFGKKLLEYEGMDRLLGTGMAGLTARGQFKDAFRGKVSKAKVRKIALGENLNKVKKVAKEDIAEQARRRAKVARQEAKTSSQVERNIGKREITFTDKDGRVLAKGVPRNKEDAQIMLRSARNQAGGIENIRVSSKDLGSPMSRFRSETEKLTEAPKGREVKTETNAEPLKAEVPEPKAAKAEKPKDPDEWVKEYDNAKAEIEDASAEVDAAKEKLYNTTPTVKNEDEVMGYSQRLTEAQNRLDTAKAKMDDLNKTRPAEIDDIVNSRSKASETPKPEKRYRVVKQDSKGKEHDYGELSEEDMKLATKGYKHRPDIGEGFYARKNSNTVFFVKEVKGADIVDEIPKAPKGKEPIPQKATASEISEPSGWENGKPLTKEDIGKMPDRPIKDSEIEAGAREANRLEEQEKYSRPIDRTESYTKGMEFYKNSKVRKQKVKELLPSNHKLNGNTKEISKAIDDDLSEIIARRNAGDMQGAEELENDLARKLAEEDKYMYEDAPGKSPVDDKFKAIKEYISNKAFYPPEGMTVKEARELFGSGVPGAKGVIKFVKRNGKKQGRYIDDISREFHELFPGALENRGTQEDFLDAVSEYLHNGYNKDSSLIGELSGKELDEFVDMKRADIRSAIRDIESDINIKAEEPVVAKAEEPKPKAEAPKRDALSDLESKQAQAASDLKETRQLMGATNKAETQRAFKNALKPKNTPRATFLREQLGKAETEEEFNIIRDELRRVGEPVNERFTPKTEPPRTVKDIDNDIKTLQKNKDRMSPRKFEEQKSILEAERKEVKAREDFEAKKIQDHKDAERIMRKPPEERTPEEVRKIVEDIENEPIAQINTKIQRSKTKLDRVYFRRVKVNMQKWFVDDGAAFENMARQAIKNGNVEEGEELYDAVNSLRQTRKSAQYQFFDAQTNLKYERVGRGIDAILSPLRKATKKAGKKSGKDFFADAQKLLYHRHNVARYKQGKPVFAKKWTGEMSLKEIEKIEAKYTDKELKLINGTNKRIRKYFDNLLKMRREEGLVTKDFEDYLRELYPDYVGTKRVIDKGDNGVSSGHNVVGAKNMQEAKGSNLDLLSIEDQMIRATNEVWSAGKTNNLIKKVMRLQGFKGDKLNLSELGKGADGEPLTFEDIISKSLFAEGDHAKGVYKLRWFEDGEAMTADCTKEVYESLKALNGEGYNPLVDINSFLDKSLGNANSIFKKLCTEWNPFFALYRNPARDIQDAFMYSKDFKSFITHMPQAMKHMAKRDKYWQLWKASGGTQSSLFDITTQIKKSKNPMRRIGLMNQAVEQYPRFTEFCSILDKELKKAGTKGTPLPVSQATREMVDKASQAGADITVNFGRSGTVTRKINKYFVPFFNPGVQGVSKGVRLITEKNGWKAYTVLAAKAAALGFAPSVINEALLHDDEGYQQMNDRDKMTNYIFHIGDSPYIKIPKGRLLSLIGMGGLKVTNKYFGGDDYTPEEMLKVASNQSAPANPLDSNLFSTALMAANNKTWYGGNIQSDYDEDKEKAQWRIYDANTTSLAKRLAKTSLAKSIKNAKGVKGLSPKKIDAILKGYSGVLGEFAMPMMTEKGEGQSLADRFKYLGKKTFTIDPRYQNELSSKFYEKKSDAAEKADDTRAKKDIKKADYFSAQSDRISAINKAIEYVQGSNADFKRKSQLLDKLQDEKNALMKSANAEKKIPGSAKYDDMGAINDIVGSKYVIDNYFSDSDKKDTKAYAKNHDLSDIINVEKDITKYGFPATRSRQPKIKALAIEEGGKGNKDLYRYFNVDKGTQRTVKAYHAAGGNMKELGGVQKNLEKIVKKVYGEKSGKSVKDLPKGALAYALSLASGKNRVYQMYDESKPMSKDYWKHSVLSGQGMVATGLTAQDRQKAYEATKGASGHPSKDAIMKYLDKQNYTKEQKSYLFWQLATWNTKENPYGDYTPKFKAKKTTSKGSGKPGQVDYSKPASKEFMNNFGANMDAERRRVGEKLYRAAKASKKGINAPYKNDKDYLPKETLQVVRSGDERLDTDALKALKSGGIKKLVKQAQKNLPKVKEPEDSDSIFGDGKEGSSGGGGRGYRRYGRRGYGRRGYGRGGSGGDSGSTGTATKKPEEIKTTNAKYDPSTWSPTKVSTDSGWTDAQIRKVYNSLIKHGLSQQQAVARIAQLWNTRFS